MSDVYSPIWVSYLGQVQIKSKRKKENSSCYHVIHRDRLQIIFLYNFFIVIYCTFGHIFLLHTTHCPNSNCKTQKPPFPVVENQYSYIVELPDITVHSLKYQSIYNIESQFSLRFLLLYKNLVLQHLKHPHTRPNTHSRQKRNNKKTFLLLFVHCHFTQKMYNPCILLCYIGDETH